MIARVALSLPINTPFDYSIPPDLEGVISKGVRVKVSFGASEAVGYVAGFSYRSSVKKLKPIISLLDKQPIIDRASFKLAEYISENYLCSTGQAIDIMLPNLLRKGRRIEALAGSRKRGSGVPARK